MRDRDRLLELSGLRGRGAAPRNSSRNEPFFISVFLPSYYRSVVDDSPDRHVIDIFMMSIKCGNCDTYQTVVGFKKHPEKNVYTYECENEICDPNVTRTLVEVPKGARQLDQARRGASLLYERGPRGARGGPGLSQHSFEPSAALAPELLGRLRERLASSPALAWLRASLEEIGPDYSLLKLPYREELSNGSGTVHGGVLATLADTAVAFALATNFDGKMGFATSDLTIHFLRRARGDVWARARIVKKGRRVNVGDVEIADSQGRLLARVIASFLLTTSSFTYVAEGKP